MVDWAWCPCKCARPKAQRQIPGCVRLSLLRGRFINLDGIGNCKFTITELCGPDWRISHTDRTPGTRFAKKMPFSRETITL